MFLTYWKFINVKKTRRSKYGKIKKLKWIINVSLIHSRIIYLFKRCLWSWALKVSSIECINDFWRLFEEVYIIIHGYYRVFSLRSLKQLWIITDPIRPACTKDSNPELCELYNNAKCPKINWRGSSQTKWSAKHQAVPAQLNYLPDVVKVLEETEESSSNLLSTWEFGIFLFERLIEWTLTQKNLTLSFCVLRR